MQLAKQLQQKAQSAVKKNVVRGYSTQVYPAPQGSIRRYENKHPTYSYGYNTYQIPKGSYVPQATNAWTTQSNSHVAKLRAAYEALTKAGLKDEAASVKKKMDALVAAQRTRWTRSSSDLSKRVDKLSTEVQAVR